MTFAELSEVWRPLDIGIAALEGLLFGLLLVGRFAANPAYASGVARPSEYGGIIALMTAASGAIFYGGQILATYAAGDQGWTRVVSRYGIWVVFSLAIGLGTWIRLRRHLAQKVVEVHDRAVSEIEADR